MPRKRIPKKLGSLTASIDHDALDKVLADAGVPPDKIKMAHQRLEALLAAVRTIEEDVGLNSEGAFLSNRPQTQALKFSDAAKALDGAMVELQKLDEPRQRLEKHPETEFFVPGVGTQELEEAVGPAILSLLNPEFLRQYGIHIEEFALRSKDRFPLVCPLKSDPP